MVIKSKGHLRSIERARENARKEELEKEPKKLDDGKNRKLFSHVFSMFTAEIVVIPTWIR